MDYYYLRQEKTVYQVYSPDEFTQEKVISKIDEDLDGAVKEWGEELEKWIFVYNARRGVPPDVPKFLLEKQRQYPCIKIDSLSKENLWDIARNLDIQQLAEVFGNPPIGYESIFLPSRKSNSEIVLDSPRNECVVLIQDVNMPIDANAVLETLTPSVPYGAPAFISPDKSSFEKAADYQRRIIEELQLKGRHILPARYAVFSLAPIPLIAHLGFLLTDSVEVKYFKFHIDTHSWKWPDVDPKSIDLNIQVTGLPVDIVRKPCEVAIRISISSKVWEYEVDGTVPGLPIQIQIYVDNPSLTWIRSEAQVERFASVFRDVLAQIRDKVSRCNGIHLFFAGPSPIVLAAGQQVNPRMNPPVHLYEYSKQTTPLYTYTLTLR